jgi:transcriptional regulator with XRE-family HTH domain
MENEINERLIRLIKIIGITQKKFCETIDIPLGTFNSMFQRNSPPSAEMLKSIAEKFPEYSINWLLSGKGDVNISNNVIGDVTNTVTERSNATIGYNVNGGIKSETHNHSISEETIRQTYTGYQEVIKTYQEHSERLLNIIEKLTKKYGTERN